ncbi:hypothetical protein Tco_0988446 [Tanacetum coccineum]|uniref:Reverse transcriptase Ty1/copia-type domain-containing protein n=1 Tax=Tanacetum coccineum TaxID=301880 RepID=A0ABQ5ERJ4_9ASTR
METQKPLLKDEDGKEIDIHMYRSMIGSLMYLTSSRSDIMFAVCACARYQVNPKVSHLHDVKRIFMYLKVQPKLGLWYPKDSPFDLVAYTDSDYAGANLDMKFTKRDEAVNEEMDDSLVRAATIASSLEAEQDSGVNTPCTNLQNRVIDLAQTKTSQAQEITSLKRRVKRLEKKKRSRTRGLKRLYKGRFNDEDMFDISVLDGDEVIVKSVDVVKTAEEIVSTAAPTIITIDEITFAQALAELKSAKPKADKVVIQEPEHGTTTTTITTTTDATTITAASIKPKAKGIVMQEPTKIEVDYQLAERLQAEEQQELNDEEKATLFMQLLEKRRKFFATKRDEENRNIPLTRAQQRSIISNRAREELTQERFKKQKIDDDKETAELKQLVKIIPEEDIVIDVIPLAVKPLSIVDWKIYKEGKKSYYRIIRADGSLKLYLVFSHMLKVFDREDLETLWKLVKAKYGSKRPVEDLDLLL